MSGEWVVAAGLLQRTIPGMELSDHISLPAPWDLPLQRRKLWAPSISLYHLLPWLPRENGVLTTHLFGQAHSDC